MGSARALSGPGTPAGGEGVVAGMAASRAPHRHRNIGTRAGATHPYDSSPGPRRDRPPVGPSRPPGQLASTWTVLAAAPVRRGSTFPVSPGSAPAMDSNSRGFSWAAAAAAAVCRGMVTLLPQTVGVWPTAPKPTPQPPSCMPTRLLQRGAGKRGRLQMPVRERSGRGRTQTLYAPHSLDRCRDDQLLLLLARTPRAPR